MISDETKKAREKVLAAHLKGESEKDVDQVLATMPEPTYDLVTVDRVLHGRKDVGTFLGNMFSMLGPNTHLADKMYHTDDTAIVEVITVFPDGFDGETLLWERVYADPAQIFPLLEGV